MDANTRAYRLGEFAAVRQDAEGAQADRTYKPTLQISSTAGKTKHISVSWEEFEWIAAMLTETGAAGAHSEPDAPGSFGRWSARYEEQGGYDTMTGAYVVRGEFDETVCVLDLLEYGQTQCEPPSANTMQNAAAHARLIAAAPDLLELARIVASGNTDQSDLERLARAALARAIA